MFKRLFTAWLGAVTLMVLVSTPLFAAQDVSSRPDGRVTFKVSTKGITRVSVEGDRIRRIVNDGSAFDMTNDENTGDVFLVYKGPEADVGEETGYIVTESGVTLGYKMSPTDADVEPVIITVVGGAAETEALEEDFGAQGIGFSDNIAIAASEIVRKVVKDHILGRQMPGGRSRVLKRTSGDGWKATVRLAAAGKEPRLVREQEFYAKGVLAVWVARNELGPNEATWVVVVEGN